MLKGIMAATVQDGPFKGWPFGGALAVSHGSDPDAVRAALIAGLEIEKLQIDEQIAAVRALPDPDGDDYSARACMEAFAPAGALSEAEALTARVNQGPARQGR